MERSIRELISVLSLVLFVTQVRDVVSHGGMLEPPMRSIAWRYGFDSPVNYDWMALYCGGLHAFQQNGGKCGICGDPYQGPYENDKGGVYDTGIIVRHYPEGLGEIEVKVELTAHHKGYFQFKLCPNNEIALTQECLNRYPLEIKEGRAQGDSYRYYPAENPKLYELHVVLPDVTCDRCVLQWTYTAGNSVGQERNGRSCLGCGIQETFVNCADISIGGTQDRIDVTQGNADPTSVGPEMVIPARNDVVDLITNGPADQSLNDFMREIGQMDTIINGQGNAADGWGFERNTGFRNVDTTPQHQQQHPQQQHMSNAWETQQSQFDNFDQRRSTWDAQASGIDRRFDNRRQNGFQLEPTVHPRGLNFEGMTDPTILRALNSHFRHPSMSHDRVMPTHQTHLARNNIASSSGSRFHSQGAIGHRSNERVIPGHGHHSTLLGSLNPLVSEITRRQQGRLPSNGFRTSSGFPTQNMFPSPTHQTRGVFSNSMTAPARSEFRHQSPTVLARVPVPTSAYHHIPRRIVVHSMDTAQHLLRRYPQLRGRVFLSRQAHQMNKYANFAHRYRSRGHW